MHWNLLDFFDANNIEYYLAYPTLDSINELENRCYLRGNNKTFTEKLKINLYDWYPRLNNYKIKKILLIQKDEYLEDVLLKEKILKK